MIVELGNVKPTGAPPKTTAVTTFQFAEGPREIPLTHQGRNGEGDVQGRLGWLSEEQKAYIVPLLEVEDAWPAHSQAPPSYVKSNDPVFAGLLSLVFNCPIQE